MQGTDTPALDTATSADIATIRRLAKTIIELAGTIERARQDGYDAGYLDALSIPCLHCGSERGAQVTEVSAEGVTTT